MDPLLHIVEPEGGKNWKIRNILSSTSLFPPLRKERPPRISLFVFTPSHDQLRPLGNDRRGHTAIPFASAAMHSDKPHPAEGNRTKQKQKFICSFCSRQFSRPSHLDRHRLTHLPPDRRLAIPCGKCGKTFGRHDVLLRHLRSAHHVDLGPKQTAQRSCDRCVQKRRKCDRAQPCRLCAAAGETCEYPVGMKRDAIALSMVSSDMETAQEASESPEGAVGMSTTAAGQSLDGSEHTRGHAPPQTAPGVTFNSNAPAGPVHVVHHASPPTAQPTTTHRGFYGGGYSPGVEGVVTFPIGAIADENVHSSFLPPNTGSFSPPFSDAEYYLAADTPFVASLSAAGQLDFRTSGLDWLDFDIPDVEACPPQGHHHHHPSHHPETHQVPSLSSTSTRTSTSDVTTTTIAQHSLPPSHPMCAHSMAPHTQPTLPSFPAPRPSNLLPWPFDQTPDFTPYRCSLPPLREVLQSTVQSQQNGTTSSSNPNNNSSSTSNNANRASPSLSPLVSGLIALMSEPRLPVPEDLVDPNVAQAVHLLSRLVDVYINRFHAILPLLHIPTWTMSSVPTVLVAAMGCIGALLSDDEHAAELSATMSEICMPMITWLGSSDSANYRDIFYLSALCLHQIYSLGSGNRQLYQNADRSRGTLVGSLRGIGCLSTRLSSVGEESPSNVVFSGGGPSPGLASSLHDEWLAWIAREREKRVAWSSFEYDCSLSTLTSRRGAVDLSELPSRVPCSDTLWEAPSANAWHALRARVPPNAFGAQVSEILQAVLPGKGSNTLSVPVPSDVSFWSKRLCAQVIGRLLWDLKQLEILSTAEYFGMPDLTRAQAENKAKLLQALDRLLASMDQPVSTADLISYNIASLICHYSHLYTAHDMLDIVVYIFRNTVSSSFPRPAKGIQIAKRRLQSVLARDPREARRLVWHAARIVAVANDYLVSAPCEIMRLFMGYIFIIAFARYCPRSQRSACPQEDTASGVAPVRLDLPSHHIDSVGAVARWIEEGGQASIGSAENIFSDKAALAISRDGQVMLQRLACWGLAEKFTKILQNFENTALVNHDL